jgi:hypothetical protein
VKPLLATAEQRDRRGAIGTVERSNSDFSGVRGILAMADAVHDRQQRAA